MDRLDIKTSGVIGDTHRLNVIKEKYGYAFNAEPSSQENVSGSDLWWMLREIERLQALVARDMTSEWVQA